MGVLIEYGRPDGGKTKGYLAEAGKGKPVIVVIKERGARSADRPSPTPRTTEHNRK